MNTSLLATIFLVFASLVYVAHIAAVHASEHNHNKAGTRHHDHHAHSSNLQAHVHGMAELTVVVEGQQVQINLIAPAESIVGFEHRAQDEQEIDQVNYAKQQLTNTEQVLKFANVKCQLAEQFIDLQSLMHKPDTHENSHDENHGGSHQSEHAEVSASYLFNCQQAHTLKSLTLELFKHFPRLTKVRAIWLTGTQQGSAMLTPANTVLELK
ncbi:ZrgA family zinc uptake protein [Thalassotalea euphylliae]|uniref:DUF2796 domain-containing protein n=1 Tax=Thalassotalea euphylliae TaxID=1655234 RepID=A0A3E0UI60_9GAMM|nr:DUF2796 domain-containing protein [Thalassotalea euphylliae]REL36284.1 DUF2796 domain-containing protein [Thalassotalea euphylliae]